jgi:hypothetical protein
MKAEFELTIDDKTGEPKIRFRHHDKSNEIEQKLLKIFVDKAKDKGIEVISTGGYLEGGTSNSWNYYEIKIKQLKNLKATIVNNPVCPKCGSCQVSEDRYADHLYYCDNCLYKWGN